MTFRHDRRTLADWTPDLGPLDAWLLEWERDGWRHEYDGDGVDVVINGRMVRRFAMIHDLRDPPDREGRDDPRRPR